MHPSFKDEASVVRAYSSPLFSGLDADVSFAKWRHLAE